MSNHSRSASKAEYLRQYGGLNPRPERVQAPLFAPGSFLDPRDLVQVKYEMLRWVDVEGNSVTDAAERFGFSRPAFYQIQQALAQGGLPGLLPQRRGPKAPHKLTEPVLAFITQLAREDPVLRAPELAERVLVTIGIRIHPRTIERALEQPGKKGRR